MPSLRPLNPREPVAKSSSAADAISALIAPEAMVVTSAAEVLNNIITSAKEYAIAAGKERTERERIAADLEKHFADVEADLIKFRAVLDKSHDEKMTLYTQLTFSVQLAAANGDHKTIEVLTNFMYQLYETDPTHGYR
ncbi:hypothetical protein [Alicyclobacillus sp. ALC3]|uniref:hypothetical protein n=1 Tax=Alicyclobacillus sp. ALC3 TaxID=2796143 RepID=UPI0023790276|nr:hypothetical protein [Alicyclobacillus sp. ALC3]WDL98509.1 hypothetical protein JC200_07465 [Alicyclobacillus sp. ALC3]